MALEPCRECGARVSTEAGSCPRCGVPEPTRTPDPVPETGECLGCGREITVVEGEDCPSCGVEDPLVPFSQVRRRDGVETGPPEVRGIDTREVLKHQFGPGGFSGAAGLLMAILGFGWALLGLMNVTMMLGDASLSAFGLILNMVLFILPGLGTGALGLKLRQ